MWNFLLFSLVLYNPTLTTLPEVAIISSLRDQFNMVPFLGAFYAMVFSLGALYAMVPSLGALYAMAISCLYLEQFTLDLSTWYFRL